MKRKQDVKQSKTTDTCIPTRLCVTCCGLVVISGCSSDPHITPAEEWLRGKRPQGDRSGTLTKPQSEHTISPTTPDMFEQLPAWLPRSKGDMRKLEILDEQRLRATLALGNAPSEARTIKEVSAEGECNEVERGGRTE